MTGERAVGHLSQIPVGEGRTFDYDGVRVAIFHTRTGEVFAVQAYCPHRGGPLADGLIDEATVVCPLHDRVYSLRSGAGVGTDCNLVTYPVRVSEDGMILLVSQPSEVVMTAS